MGDRLKRDRGGVLNFSTSEIRKLFRSFDIDNDHVLQHKEFQQGMLMMGLHKAADPYVANQTACVFSSDPLSLTSKRAVRRTGMQDGHAVHAIPA